MLTAFTFFQFSVGVHAVAAVSFLGVAGANSVIGPAMRANPQHALFGLGLIKRIYEVAVFPGIALILLTGIYQSVEGPWKGDDLWLTIGVTLFMLVAIAGIFVLYPATKVAIEELEKKGDTPGPPSERFIAQTKKFRTLGPTIGVTMIIITFLMSAKPF